LTGRELVAAILRKLGASAPGESIANSEAQDGLAEVNRMIASMSNEKLLIYAITEEGFSLVAGTAAYTLGSGATWNSSRPQWIEKAVIRDSSTSPAVDYPVDLFLSVDEFSKISVKGATSPYPYALYDDGGYPYRTIKLYPTPSAAHTLRLWSAKPISSIATLDTTLSLPPGYEDMLVYNGAVRLAPEYGKTLAPEVVAIAMDSKAGIKRANHKSSYLKIDSSLPGQSGGFNINTGDFE